MIEDRKKSILVTGAASGIGAAIVNYLAKKGELVFAADVDEKGLERYQSNNNIFSLFIDVTNQPSIDNAVNQIKKEVDSLDCIINNAGIFVGGSLLDVDINEIKKIFKINVFGYIRITQAFHPLLAEDGGLIINISSEVGRIVFPFTGPYSMSKYAIEAFSDALRRELRFLNQKVVIIQPGATKTAFSTHTVSSYEKTIEGSQFYDQLQRVWGALEKEKYRNPQKIAKKVYKILHSKNPKLRYRINNNKQRRILEFFPQKWVDFLIEKFI